MTTNQAMKIGDAAAALGIEAHVLRHWESVGLLAPQRSPSGHRSYDEHILDYARLIQILQRTGLSLGQIRQLGHSAHEQRLELIAARRAEVRDRMALLRATNQFLEHITACAHPIIAQCPECSDFVKQSHTHRAGEFPTAASVPRQKACP
jgi:DNA-binding transcriptional MerR regulator